MRVLLQVARWAQRLRVLIQYPHCERELEPQRWPLRVQKEASLQQALQARPVKAVVEQHERKCLVEGRSCSR